ncbi:MAG: class I SAM-dependent methyltransferase [Thiobacillus sp.]|uniref:class I SAM-dependent methyltransferase n=1 Tax=Thiobacillus sp. TaxID=924 RepID=UPI0027359366|nr:class I SAM-dependent methyltransferase [Thiobacillus sp.]MDP3584125.1 class I SAM-dependent methyltransferase [Thiobacillus sp.]
MDTLQSYDELPYDSLPLPETQPDFLAAVARLHGFVAPDPARARILELGCAQGGNLIPLAWRWPESECVGIELSRVQAEAGAAFIEALGLSNARILHGDLAALPDDLGEFDYIIAHGVFSWVPPAVQQALLDVCRHHLSPQGVAYVSFNVSTGWEKLQPLRAALTARTSADLAAPERFQQALRVLDDLSVEWSDPDLLKEVAYLKSAAPSYLFHEYLADFNVPMTFGEFAAQLDQHDLRYVGEAGPRRAVVELEDAWGLIPESMAGRWLDAESALDDALGTRFRRALIARTDAPCAQPPQAAALSGLAFYSDLASNEEIDLEAATEQAFVNPAGNTFHVALPWMKAAVMVLSAAYPGASGYPDLLGAARQVMADYGVADDTDERAFSEALFQLVATQGVMVTVWTGPTAAEPGERPAAHALARQQASTPGWVVSGARHVAIDLDPAGRLLLGWLDGRRTVDELTLQMQASLARSGVDLPLERLREPTWQQLWLFARQGLLMA